MEGGTTSKGCQTPAKKPAGVAAHEQVSRPTHRKTVIRMAREKMPEGAAAARPGSPAHTPRYAAPHLAIRRPKSNRLKVGSWEQKMAPNPAKNGEGADNAASRGIERLWHL